MHLELLIGSACALRVTFLYMTPADLQEEPAPSSTVSRGKRVWAQQEVHSNSVCIIFCSLCVCPFTYSNTSMLKCFIFSFLCWSWMQQLCATEPWWLCNSKSCWTSFELSFLFRVRVVLLVCCRRKLQFCTFTSLFDEMSSNWGFLKTLTDKN